MPGPSAPTPISLPEKPTHDGPLAELSFGKLTASIGWLFDSVTLLSQGLGQINNHLAKTEDVYQKFSGWVESKLRILMKVQRTVVVQDGDEGALHPRECLDEDKNKRQQPEPEAQNGDVGKVCLDPEKPEDNYCHNCFNVAYDKCTAKINEDDEIVEPADQKTAVALCVAEFACNEEHVCKLWKCKYCKNQHGCPSSLLGNTSQKAALTQRVEETAGLKAMETQSLDNAVQSKCS